MRASLLQIDVNPDETVEDRRTRVGDLVAAQKDADLVVLPELWPVGAFAYDLFDEHAELLEGPTFQVMSEAARQAGAWLHAGSIVERATDGTLFNTSLVLDPEGQLAQNYRKIHRFGFDKGEATMMGAGVAPATVTLPDTQLGLATCYDLRFPELFRTLVDAGSQVLVIPAGWPAKRAEHWTLLARARAVENQTFVLACGTAGEHAGVPQAGRSAVYDPWGEVVAATEDNEERVVTAEFDLSQVASVRESFPALKDRVL
ncbi:carbon-nitrogen family hydrolase [Streptomyces sp. NPDC005438]|uniref:carbon-nitrogen family hydrolase n=1 Tax=Streptomyces sp. NPDC005438 TaxID=3156880 RepID=UPI0033AB8E96